MFAYCGNNPVIRIDDSGEFFFTILGAAIGAISGAFDSFAMGGTVDDIAIGAFAGAVSGAISGAGVDIGVAVTAATGGTGVGAGVAIAGTFGAVGSYDVNQERKMLERMEESTEQILVVLGKDTATGDFSSTCFISGSRKTVRLIPMMILQ